MFAEYFSTVYSNNYLNIPTHEFSTSTVHIPNHHILISDIFTKISNLDINKGPGPDGVPPIFLKKCSFNISRPLFHIFNLSLRTGIFPDYWKESFLKPIFKSGDKSSVTNYRPISIISTIPKIFESLVCDFITPLIEPQLIKEQFGFRPGRSTELNLLTHIDFLLDGLERGCQVDTIYTDFSRTFDRVSHSMLLHKLKLIGVDEPLISWFHSYLSGRRQTVKIGNFLSKIIHVTSGVPQGSHLGPLLFNVFINDIHECFTSSLFLLFADDLKLSCIIKSPLDCDKLQYDLNNLVEWCKRNGMDLNSSKCKAVTFTRSKASIKFDYKIDHHILEKLPLIKDLGVILDENLNFINHLSNAVNKAFQMLGFIKRTTQDFTSIPALKSLYCSLVRPHLEYASCTWTPSYGVHINSLQLVEHKFLKLIAFKLNILDNYNDAELLSMLNMVPLSLRHKRRNLVTFYNIPSWKISCPRYTS